MSTDKVLCEVEHRIYALKITQRSYWQDILKQTEKFSKNLEADVRKQTNTGETKETNQQEKKMSQINQINPSSDISQNPPRRRLGEYKIQEHALVPINLMWHVLTKFYL